MPKSEALLVSYLNHGEDFWPLVVIVGQVPDLTGVTPYIGKGFDLSAASRFLEQIEPRA